MAPLFSIGLNEVVYDSRAYIVQMTVDLSKKLTHKTVRYKLEPNEKGYSQNL